MLVAYIVVTVLLAWWMSSEFRSAAHGVMDQTARLIGHEVSAALHDVSVDNLVQGDPQARRRLSQSLGSTARASSVLSALSIVDRNGTVVASDGMAAVGSQLARPSDVFSEDSEARLFSTFAGPFDTGNHVLLTPILKADVPGDDALVGYIQMNLNNRAIGDLYEAAYWRLLILSLAGLIAIVTVGILMHIRMSKFQYRVASLFDSALAGKRFEEPAANDDLGQIQSAAQRLGRELYEARGRAELSRHELATLATALKVGMLLLDGGAEVQFSNAAAREMLSGGRPDEFTKWYAEISDLLRETMADMRRKDAPTSEVDIALDFDAGRRRFRVELYAMTPQAGGRHLVVVKDRDMTDALETDLRTATRFRGLSVLYVGAAHDLRGPLNNMVVNLELLKQTLKNADPERAARPEAVRQRNYIETVQQEVYRLNRYVQALLDLTAPTQDAVGELDLAQALNEIAGLIRAQAKLQHVELDWQSPDRPIVIRCHQVQFRQVLLNVIINALEAMPDGGTLTLRLSQEASSVHVEICDTGPGIPENLHQRIFDMHFTTKKTGTGIGLYVAQSIIAEHGGYIGVRNRPGGGACFDLHVAASEAAPSVPSGSEGLADLRREHRL